MPFIRHVLTLLITCNAVSISAEENSKCQSKLFDRFIKVEKTGYKLPNRLPDEELQERMGEFEILCPWQVEIDFNNDQQRDWVGLVAKDNATVLLAYISGVGNYKSTIVKQYTGFPRETHFDYMPVQEAALMSKKKFPEGKKARFALIENKIGKPSTIYIWNGESMVRFDDFKGSY